MSSNPNVKMPITNDLRSKVLQKFTLLHSKLQTATPPEQLERSCYDKANNDQETYIKLCNNLVANRTKQLENSKNNIVVNNQVRGVMNSNFRPNMVGQNNNGVVSDPINALQNLTVTAGQPNQINIQQANQQINYRMNTPNMIQMNSGGQIQQRIMVTGNRPLDQFSMQQQQQMSNSPNPQMISSQIVHGINPMNVVNTGNTIRLINKTATMKPDQIITSNQTMMPAYQIDSNGPGQINNQHITNVMHTPVVRTPVNRIVSSSPNIPAQHQSPQEHYTMTNQIPQTVTIVQNNSIAQSDMIASHQNISPNNNSVPKIVASPQNVASPQTVASSQNNVPPPQNAPPPLAKIPMTREEAMQVKGELARLSAKYYKYLQLALDNPLNTPMETVKIWSVLKGLLDSSRVCDKPITLKHVAKIQMYSEKAEEHVIQNNLDPSRSQGNALSHNNEHSHKLVQGSEEIFGKRVIPDRNKTAFIPETNANNIDIGSAPSHTNSLDVAFDSIVHQINKQDKKDKRKTRDNLIKFIKNEKRQFMHFLPRHLQTDSEPMDVKDHDTDYDEHEFDFIDEIPLEDGHLQPKTFINNAFDQNGLLRTDSDRSHCISDPVDAKKEIALLENEFDIKVLELQTKNSDWISGESEWDNSVFYSLAYRNQDLNVDIPPILVRIPEDYEQSSSVDWNLNLRQYPGTMNSDADVFLGHIQISLQDEFSNLSSHPWNGVPLLDIMLLYKRSIQTGYSNYECRKSICK